MQYNLPASELEKLDPNQQKSIRETEEYLKKHKIHLLFQELLGSLIETRSTSPRRQLAELLKNKKKGEMYFNETDFEILFQYFDPHQTKTAQLHHLLDALRIIGIKSDATTLLSRYPTHVSKEYVYQDEFIDILKNEYHVKHKSG